MTRLTIAHIALETTTPLSIASGSREGVRDTSVVKDAYGLPTIPGSSIAGVLRDLYRDSASSMALAEAELFGSAKNDGGGSRSKLDVSFAIAHGSNDKPLTSPLIAEKNGDALARWYLTTYASEAPMRHRVRINERGAADAEKRGKFDRDIVPRGARFTFELRFLNEGGDKDKATWRQLLECLRHPLFRLGGQTRAGLGALRIHALSQWDFDLSTAEGVKNYADVADELKRFSAVLDPSIENHFEAKEVATKRYSVQAEDFWRIGQDSRPLSVPGDVSDVNHATGAKADMAPYVESAIIWDGGQGAVDPAFLIIPASSIKGALRHRTAFHYDRLSGALVERRQLDKSASKSGEALVDLFGEIHEEDISKSKRGRVIIDDILIPLKKGHVDGVQTLAHNSVDRFTGGVRDKVLFSERMIFRGDIDLTIHIESSVTPVAAVAERALEMALEDLCAGRLPIGAAGGRGHGRLKQRKQA